MPFINSTLEPQSDLVGVIASGLCLVHCVATPFLFIAQGHLGHSCSASSPVWWNAIDFIFIVITFFAVRQSGKNSSKPWMATALITIWAILTTIIINEKVGIVHLSSIFKHIAALSLIGLHLYNLKFCKCQGDECCHRF